MNKYIDAERLKAEIEERIALLKGVNSKGDYARGSIDADMGILEYITSLQQEKPQVADASKMEQPNVELEEFISNFFDKKDAENNGRWCEEDIVEAITEAYELGLNARK